MSDDGARLLTEFLTASPGYGRRSPLVESVEGKIKELTSAIANEIIDEHMELRDVIRRKVNAVVVQALRDDAYLNSLVTEAVARAITQRALTEDD